MTLSLCLLAESHNVLSEHDTALREDPGADPQVEMTIGFPFLILFGAQLLCAH